MQTKEITASSRASIELKGRWFTFQLTQTVIPDKDEDDEEIYKNLFGKLNEQIDNQLIEIHEILSKSSDGGDDSE